MTSKKTCSSCNEELHVSEFIKNKQRKDGLHSQCKSCVNEKRKKYREVNYEKIRSKQKEYEKQNYEKILSRTREWREKNREKIRLKSKAYYLNNSERLKEYSKSWKLNNQDRVKAHAKSWASKIQGRHAEIWKKRKEENPQKLIEKRRNYYRKNKEIENSRANNYMKTRRRIVPIFRLRCSIRSRISTVLKRQGIGKSSSTAEILGCNWDTLRLHIESLFLPGMTWENRDLWHIDHKIPLSSASSSEEVIRLNHYTNLQPLWAEDNLKKGAKLAYSGANESS